MYLKISNRGSLHRDEVRLIGFSAKANKAENRNKIGQFGTGTAYATIAALRLGLEVAISSTDRLGLYFLRFEIEDLDMGGGKKTREVYLHYWGLDEAGKVVSVRRLPWNVDLAAFRDWDRPIGDDESRTFKLLREFICNARDEDTNFSVDVAEEQSFAPEGRTEVYIEYSEELDSVIKNPGRYFKFLDPKASRLVVPGVGFITTKSQKDVTRLFVQGVLVSCSLPVILDGSVLDYSLDDKDLVSEDRTIKTQHRFRRELGRLITGIRQENLVKGIIAFAVKRSMSTEREALATVTEVDEPSRSVWIKALREFYGWEDLCIASGVVQTDEDARQVYGYLPIQVDSNLAAFFHKALGIPHAKDIAPPQPDLTLLRFRDFSAASRQRFRAAFRIFAKYFPDRSLFPVTFFLAKDGNVQKRVGAYAGSGDAIYKEIWIKALSETELPAFWDLLWLLVHESRHCATRAGDYERPFVKEAQMESMRFMARLEGRKKGFDDQSLPPLGSADALLPIIVDPKTDDAEEDFELDIDLGELDE